MFEAIMKNRVEFVDMFLQNNFDMRSFLDDRVLLRLYNTVEICIFNIANKISVYLLNLLLKISDNHYIIALMMKITNLVGRKIEFYHLGNFLNVLIDDLFCHKYTNYIPQSSNWNNCMFSLFKFNIILF